MNLMIMFLILFTVSAALAYLFKYRFEQTIAITCFALILILYLFGLAGIMSAGVYAAVALSLGAITILIYAAAKGRIKKDFFINNIFTPGFLVFLCFYIIMCYLQRNRFLEGTDEFSHWGLVVKNMYFFDTFGNHPEATTIFTGYPPASSLFQYLWMKICGFAEANFFRSMNVLCFSSVLPVFKNVGWKQIKKAPFIALIIFIIPVYLYNGFYFRITVDPLLGILLAYILFAYFTEKVFNYAFYINLALAMFVLTLVKASGFGLAIIAAMIIMLDIAINIQKTRKTMNLPDNKKNVIKANHLYNLYTVAIAILIPVISNYTWSIYRSFSNTRYAWDGVSNITLSSVAELIKGEADQYRYDTIRYFISAFFSNPVDVGRVQFTYFQWALLLAFIILFFWCAKSEAPLKNKLKNCLLGLLIGWIIYVASLLILYVFTFSAHEAIALASFRRYMNTYFLASLCFFVCFFFYHTNEEDEHQKTTNLRKYIIFLVIALFFLNFAPLFRTFQISPGRRAEISISKISSVPFDYKSDRINYIYQYSTGYPNLVARYEMTPVRVSGSYSIGMPYDEDDRWTNDITCDEWLEILKTGGFTYVYLEYIDEQFIERFNEAFENINMIQNQSLYRVTDRDGRIVLEYVDI